MKKKALYPGSFDCFTYGHLDIIQRALRIFDQVIVGVASNRQKNYLFSPEERVAIVRSALPDTHKVQVISFSGLTIQEASRLKVHAIIRGLRMMSDCEYEFQMDLMNKSINSQIETVYFSADKKYMFLSSSLVREIASLGGSVSAYLPPPVEQALLKKLHG